MKNGKNEITTNFHNNALLLLQIEFNIAWRMSTIPKGELTLQASQPALPIEFSHFLIMIGPCCPFRCRFQFQQKNNIHPVVVIITSTTRRRVARIPHNIDLWQPQNRRSKKKLTPNSMAIMPKIRSSFDCSLYDNIMMGFVCNNSYKTLQFSNEIYSLTLQDFANLYGTKQFRRKKGLAAYCCQKLQEAVAAASELIFYLSGVNSLVYSMCKCHLN